MKNKTQYNPSRMTGAQVRQCMALLDAMMGEIKASDREWSAETIKVWMKAWRHRLHTELTKRGAK